MPGAFGRKGINDADAESGLDAEALANSHYLINFVEKPDGSKVLIFKKKDASRNKEMFFAAQLRPELASGAFEMQKHLSTDSIWDVYMFFNFQGQQGFFGEDCPVHVGRSPRKAEQSGWEDSAGALGKVNAEKESHSSRSVEVSVDAQSSASPQSEDADADSETSDLIERLKKFLAQKEIPEDGGSSQAQSAEEPSPGTQASFDAIVDSVKKTVESEVRDPNAQIEISAQLINFENGNASETQSALETANKVKLLHFVGFQINLRFEN